MCLPSIVCKARVNLLLGCSLPNCQALDAIQPGCVTWADTFRPPFKEKVGPQYGATGWRRARLKGWLVCAAGQGRLGQRRSGQRTSGLRWAGQGRSRKPCARCVGGLIPCLVLPPYPAFAWFGLVWAGVLQPRHLTPWPPHPTSPSSSRRLHTAAQDPVGPELQPGGGAVRRPPGPAAPGQHRRTGPGAGGCGCGVGVGVLGWGLEWGRLPVKQTRGCRRHE